jgi:hypothetical protein
MAMRVNRIAGPALAGLVFGTALLAGCQGDTSGPGTREEIAVFGYLYVGESLADSNAIVISRVRPIGDYYDFDRAAVDDAIVSIAKADGPLVVLFHVGPGKYANSSVTIEPLTTYDLRVSIPGEEEIRASTRTPHAFTLTGGPPVPVRPVRHSVMPDSFPMSVDCDDPDQIFLVDVYCLENWKKAHYINSFGPKDTPQSYEEYGGDNGEPRHIFAYFRMRNLVREGSGYTIDFYNAMMAYYGSYNVQVLAIDDNYYRYLYKDHPEENGGVIGGIGVFGAAARRGWAVEVVK